MVSWYYGIMVLWYILFFISFLSAGVAASGNSFSEPVSEKNVHCIMVLYGILWYYMVLYGIIYILYSWYYWYQVTPTTAAAATAAAAISQQLSQPGKAQGGITGRDQISRSGNPSL